MNGGTFSIIDSVKNAYIFSGREFSYLLKIGMLPMLVNLATTAYTSYAHPDAGVIERFLWGFPTSLLYGWYMFAQSRLILMGERIDRLPQEPEFLMARRRCMHASVIISLLFNMTLAAFAATMQWADPKGMVEPDTTVSGMIMLLIGAIFWGIRFALAPIVAAVGLSVIKFIYRINGVGISLRMIGLMSLSALPITFVFMFLGKVLFGEKETLSTLEIIAIWLLGAPVPLITITILNAASVFAVKEIMNRPERRAS